MRGGGARAAGDELTVGRGGGFQPGRVQPGHGGVRQQPHGAGLELAQAGRRRGQARG